jgi:hypothetical protein
MYWLQGRQVVLRVRKRNMKRRTGTRAISQEVALEHLSQFIGKAEELRGQPTQLVKLGSELGGVEGSDRLGHVLHAGQQKGSDLKVAR